MKRSTTQLDNGRKDRILKYRQKAMRIRAIMMTRGVTPAEVARRLHCSCCSVSHVLAGRQRTAPIQRRIAEICGVPASELFGDTCHPTLMGVNMAGS